MTGSNESPAKSVMIVAGEASGDQHAANMFRELKEVVPNLSGFGMGGRKMAEAGIKIHYDSTAIAVIGAVEVLRHYPEILRVLKQMQALLLSERPDLLVCVDYKEFNYKLARFAKKHGIKVLFYVSPQVWAWRPGRVVKYGRAIDMMAVIFPFEVPYYQAEDIPVRYVGHPSVDKVSPDYPVADAKQLFGLDPGARIVGLLPGSRKNEVIRILPEMLKAAAIIRQKCPDTQFVLAQTESIEDELIQHYLGNSEIEVIVIKNHPYDVIQCCDALMTFSGTATLEVALLGVPMVIVCKVSPITYWLGRLLVKSPYIGLPNIIRGQCVIKELIQDKANAADMADEISRILIDQKYNRAMRDSLAAVRKDLGTGGGSHNMAILAAEMLEHT